MDDDSFYRRWAGIDLDWFCVDTVGRLGHFAAFQVVGPESFPECVVRDLAAAESFWGQMRRLPERCGWRRAREAAGCQPGGAAAERRYFAGMSTMARKGCFAFDRDTNDLSVSRYILACLPDDPLGLDDLPADLQTLARLFRVGIEFEHSEKIDIATI